LHSAALHDRGKEVVSEEEYSVPGRVYVKQVYVERFMCSRRLRLQLAL
jgi:hypothetical protein